MVRGVEAAQNRLDRLPDLGALNLIGERTGNVYVARHPLLQEELGSMDHRFTVEAAPHDSVMNDVVQRQQRHPLVMRHICPDDRGAYPSGSRSRVKSRAS